MVQKSDIINNTNGNKTEPSNTTTTTSKTSTTVAIPDKKKMVVSAKNWSVFQKSMSDGSTGDETRGLP